MRIPGLTLVLRDGVEAITLLETYLEHGFLLEGGLCLDVDEAAWTFADRSPTSVLHDIRQALSCGSTVSVSLLVPTGAFGADLILCRNGAPCRSITIDTPRRVDGLGDVEVIVDALLAPVEHLVVDHEWSEEERSVSAPPPLRTPG